MTTDYSVSVDNWDYEQWEFTGRDVMYNAIQEEGTEQHKEATKQAKDCNRELEEIIDELADQHFPMMLYAYPLYSCPDDEKIIKLCEETCCTVVMNQKTEDYFLALCGGGMNLSQDIALAYIIARGHIPDALAAQVSTQYGLSKSGDNWRTIMKQCKKDLQQTVERYNRRISEIDGAIERHKQE